LVEQKQRILYAAKECPEGNKVSHFISGFKFVFNVSDFVKHEYYKKKEKKVHAIKHKCVNS
jgi:hypothetical protein